MATKSALRAQPKARTKGPGTARKKATRPDGALARVYDFVREPQQARSRETYHRILDAAEALMETASFEKISIQSIIAKAGVPTGSFYARFPDKMALLGVLYERYIDDIAAATDRDLPKVLRQEPDERVRLAVELIGGVYRLRTAVARSAVLHYWNSDKAAAFLDALAPRQTETVGKVMSVFISAAEEYGCADAKAVGSFAAKMALVSSREHYLFKHKVKNLVVSDEEFQTRLADMIIAYLSGGRKK